MFRGLNLIIPLLLVVVLAHLADVMTPRTFAEEPGQIDPIPLPEGAKLVGPHSGHGYKPFELDGARLVPRIEFLQEGRDWERLDVYIPESAKPGDRLPCVINLYGGGYGEKGTGNAMKASSQAFVDAGYVVVCSDYAIGVTYAPVIAGWDVANAIRHIRAHAAEYQVDPERIGLIGWSAGGWLSQFVGYANPDSLHYPRYQPSRETGPQPSVKPQWSITGLIGRKYNTGKGGPSTQPCLRLDRHTGELTGVPRHPGVYPVVVGCHLTTDGRNRPAVEDTTTDARCIIITVEEKQ